MATIDELKRRIDLPALAEWLGLKKAAGGAGSTSWHADESDKNPSLSIFKDKKQEWRYKDHRGGDHGTCVDLVMKVRSCDIGTAVKLLHEFAGIPLDVPKQEKREKSRAEFIAERCLDNPEPVIGYLTRERKLPLELVKRAIERRAIGFNTWTSSSRAAGEVGHGGPAAAFIVRSQNPGHVVAVDLRYITPEINGGVKTQSQGEKAGFPWTSDWRRLHAAETVYIVESAINALSIEAAELPRSAAVATRGTATVEGIDWRFLAGKQAILTFDHDEPDEKTGVGPGQAAARKLHEILTGLDISALMVDQADWNNFNDVNDILIHEGAEKLQQRLKNIEQWLIPGQAPNREERRQDEKRNRARVWLPYHDFNQYSRYRVRPDFTSSVEEKERENKDGQIETYLSWSDVAGFRVAAVSRVTIASASSTMTGDPDSQPKVMFAVSVQTPRHGARLTRSVLEDDKLHNVEVWKKFGPVFKQSPFLRMLNILERGAHMGARNAANFVGLAWREGKLIVNEGPNCYFTDPEKQCPYYNLTFPSGTLQDARTVIEAYQATFKHNAALLVLVWAMGGHLKALLGFWPHLMMQAAKGAGKSTLTQRLGRTIALTMFSGQSLNTEFRLLTSVSHTSHPIGWEELSARHQQVIDRAISLLQEAYNYTVTRRGMDMTEFLVSAPVLLAGEDVPVRSLIGKLIRTELTGKKGVPLPHDLPRFPVRQWLEFLASLNKRQILERYEKAREIHLEASRASGEDDGAVRMAGNYAAVALAWSLLCEFCEIDVHQGGFLKDLLSEMNGHIGESSADREPWVWIVEMLLSEIATSNFRHPYTWDSITPDDGGDPEPCLLVRTSHVMDHLAHTSSLRDKWNSLPVKSDRVFKKELKAAGVVLSDTVERSIGGGHGQYGEQHPGKRVSHLTALSLDRLHRFGLHAVGPDDKVPAAPPDDQASRAGSSS